jgi:BolA protein
MRAQNGGSGETREYSRRGVTILRNPKLDFSIRVVSDAFKGKVRPQYLNLAIGFFDNTLQSPIQRHRMINTALSEEFANGLHALSLEARTEEEAARTSQ